MSPLKRVKVTTPSGRVFEGYTHGGGRNTVFASNYEVSLYKNACILLHPHHRQRDDPLGENNTKFPQQIGGNLYMYGLIVTCVNPETEEVLEQVPYDKLPIFAEDYGTWIPHYGVDKIKGVKVVPQGSLK